MPDAGARAEVHRDLASAEDFGIVERPLSRSERLYNNAWLRKIFILVALAVIVLS